MCFFEIVKILLKIKHKEYRDEMPGATRIKVTNNHMPIQL